MFDIKGIKRLHHLLEQTTISPQLLLHWLESGDNTELLHQLHPISEHMSHYMPQKLFRIRNSADYCISAFEKDEMSLSRADNFNDPYDCLLYFDSTALFQKIKAHLSPENLRNSLINKLGIADTTAVNSSILDALAEHYYQNLNPFLDQIQGKLPEAAQFLQQSTFVASLTQEITSPIMWSHYGENHSGFALEYVFQPSYCVPHPYTVPDADYEWHGWRSLLPVLYSEKRVDATTLADWFCFCEMAAVVQSESNKYDRLSLILPDLLLKTKLCLQKSKVWSYEKEWRLIITCEWPNHIESTRMHLIKAPTALYLGSRVAADTRNTLLGIAQSKGISVFEMYIDYNCPEYKMNYKQIL